MSISSLYAQLNPRERAIYPDGVHVILALLGLGGSPNIKAAARQMFGSDQGMIDYVRRIHALDQSPEIRSESAIFFTERQQIISEDYYKLVQNLVSIFRINFNDQTALDQLNRWIEERSGFPNVLKSSDVRDAFAIAVNTLWFKDQWVHQFDPASTMPLPFHRLDGSTVNLPMMRQANKKIRYYQQDGISAVQLPFRHGAVAEFVLGLPVGSDISVDLPYGNEGIEVSLALPRFKHQERINLERVVEAAGLGGLFEAGSLQGMVPETSPMGKYNAGVSKFEQLIYAEFNEEGAEVRAVTYATVRTAIVMEKRIVMHFDRPFHYRIIKDGSTLLQGYYGAEKEMGVPPAAPRSPMVPAPSMYGMTTRY